jgi:hypothetical protein
MTKHTHVQYLNYRGWGLREDGNVGFLPQDLDL